MIWLHHVQAAISHVDNMSRCMHGRSIDQADCIQAVKIDGIDSCNCCAAASSSLCTSTAPKGSPKKPDLEIPPPPAQPVHQSASAAELAAQAREAEQAEQDQAQQQGQSQTAPAPAPHVTSKQTSPGQAESTDKGQARDTASKAPPREASTKAAGKDTVIKAGAKDTAVAGKGPAREATGAGVVKEHKAPAKAPNRAQAEPRPEVEALLLRCLQMTHLQ